MSLKIGVYGVCSSPVPVNIDPRSLLGFCHQVSGSALGVFTPTILNAFGYTAIDAILYTIPIHVCSITWGILNAFLADRFNHRSTFLLLSILVSMVGISMAGWADSRHTRLAGMFLAGMGIICIGER
jgi:MFS family permease